MELYNPKPYKPYNPKPPKAKAHGVACHSVLRLLLLSSSRAAAESAGSEILARTV